MSRTVCFISADGRIGICEKECRGDKKISCDECEMVEKIGYPEGWWVAWE